jgi:hypothetical protein
MDMGAAKGKLERTDAVKRRLVYIFLTSRCGLGGLGGLISSFLAAQGTGHARFCYLLWAGNWRTAGEEAEMAGKDKSKSDEKQKHDEKDEELEQELEDTFPASDPPSLTQPSESGGPDREGERK